MKNRQKLIIETVYQLEEGWAIDKGEAGYQLISTSNVFKDDLDVIDYVVKKAFEDKESIYADALRVLFELNPSELEIIQSVVSFDLDDVLFF